MIRRLKKFSNLVHEVKYCSQWVINNVKKFSKKMDVSLEDMEDLSYFFFSEFEKKNCL